MQDTQQVLLVYLTLLLHPCYTLHNTSCQSLKPQSLEDKHVEATDSASISVSVYLLALNNNRTVQVNKHSSLSSLNYYDVC
jgi:hypothetical protein